MKERRVIPIKNYAILAIIAIAVLILGFYWMTWYKATENQRLSHSVIANFSAQISVPEMDSYIVDNPHAILYFASATDASIHEFEKRIKNLVLKYDIKDQFVYVNTDEIKNADFYQKFADHYFSDNLKERHISFAIRPNLLMISEGKVIDILSKQVLLLEENEIKQFIEIYEVMTS